MKGSGSVAANGLLVGSLSAGLGVGIPGANVKAHASGSLRLSGSGSATRRRHDAPHRRRRLVERLGRAG